MNSLKYPLVSLLNPLNKTGISVSRQFFRFNSSHINTLNNASSSFTSETKKALDLLRQDPSYYAILEVKSFPYKVAKNDIIVTGRLKDLSIGDTISLNRVREIGSDHYLLRGNPFVHPSYFSIKATVLEHQVATVSKKRQQRSGRSKTVENENHYTLLRISELEIANPNQQSSQAENVAV